MICKLKFDAILYGMKTPPLTLYLVSLLGLFAKPLLAVETTIAVAANFSAPMQKLAIAFHEETGHTVKISFGSTGKFFTQIAHGAPFDILLAADQDTPQRLENEGLGEVHSRFTYATGALVLWSAREKWIDPKADILQLGQFNHLAVADPKLAPYGAAAMQTLKSLNLLEKLQTKFVQGENIGQTYQFVATGNAELGFVALSQVYTEGHLREGSAWIVPQNLYQPLHQDAILLKNGKDNPAAKSFLTYLKSDQAKKIMQNFGYAF